MKTPGKGFFPKRALALLFAIIALTACHNEMTDYEQTVRSGLSTLPWPKEMEALFGGGDHAITHYGFSSEPRDWWTEIYFGGRYRLTMHVDVEIDYKKNIVVRHTSAPRFTLSEVKSLERLDGGQIAASYSGQWFFDEAKWNKLIEAKGDWSAIGLSVKTNAPVPGFDEYVKAWRTPRVQVK